MLEYILYVSLITILVSIVVIFLYNSENVSNSFKIDNILDLFRKERKLYSELLQNPDHLYGILVKGEEKARVIADKVLERVRSKLGY